MNEKIKEEQVEVSWDEAIDGGLFVKFEEDKAVELTIKNWQLLQVTKDFNGETETKVEFTSQVIDIDGKPAKDKVFNTVSNRLKSKLKAILEKKDPGTPVKLRIIKIGKNFDTNYSVVEL